MNLDHVQFLKSQVTDIKNINTDWRKIEFKRTDKKERKKELKKGLWRTKKTEKQTGKHKDKET
jgi:hypothetical protein